MTVAVAARFPWGLLRNVVTSLPGSTFPSAIILAADSRWTYENAPPEDVGQKVWPIAPERGIGAVFAGDVVVAETAFGRIQRRLKRIQNIQPNVVAQLASEVLKRTYENHKKKRNVWALYVIFGMANALGQSAMIYLSSATGFASLFVDGVVAIGWPSACEKFREQLPDIESSLLPRDGSSGGSWSMEVDVWAMQLAAHMYHDVIEPGEEETVGGHVQMAIIGSRGWAEQSVSMTASDPLKPESWQQITIDRKRLKTFLRVPRLASGEFELGFHQLSN